MTAQKFILIAVGLLFCPVFLSAQGTTDTITLNDETTPTEINILLPLASETSVTINDLSAPMKVPSLSTDLDTTITVPDVPRAKIYWGNVGDKGGYSLAKVMEIVRQANPNWATFSANHAAAHAELVASCAFPNPDLELEFGSETSEETGDSRNIWSLGFSQPIELPGKRAARHAEALAGFAVVQGEQYEYANTLKADVREAYWTIQYHSALEQMHATQVSLTQSQFDLAQQRVELGDAGRIELTNAKVELLKSRREREIAKRRKEGAKAALNALTGGRLGDNIRLAQDFDHNYERPSLKTAIQQSLEFHPKLSRLAAELEQRYASITRQNREWWPDPKIGARKSKEFDGDSMAVTLGMEIPLWNRNEGGIAKAEAEAHKVYAQIGIAYNDLRRDVEVAYQNLMLAREQIASYDEGLRDAAEELVDLAYQQFNLGGGGYLDVLIARRQLLETQQGYIQALFDAATARARFDQAVGR